MGALGNYPQNPSANNRIEYYPYQPTSSILKKGKIGNKTVLWARHMELYRLKKKGWLG
jgi:hypothetical protein